VGKSRQLLISKSRFLAGLTAIGLGGVASEITAGVLSSKVETSGCSTSAEAGTTALTGADGVAVDTTTSAGDTETGGTGKAATLEAAAGLGLAKGIAAGGCGIAGGSPAKYESSIPVKKAANPPVKANAKRPTLKRDIFSPPKRAMISLSFENT
jgi:hypothetical protein